MFALCAIFRLGFLANFLSEPILVGFVGGLALDILISQVAKMLGVEVDSGADVIPRVIQLVEGLDTINWWSVAISVVSVAILVLGRRLLAAIPWALVVLVVTTTALALFHLDEFGVSMLGPVEAGPPMLTWPMITGAQWVAGHPERDRPDAGRDRRGSARRAPIRREERLRDEREPRPARLRRRQRRGRSQRGIHGRLVGVAHRGDGLLRGPHASCRRSSPRS